MTTLTFALMDPPYEDARSTTALRLIDIAARRGAGQAVEGVRRGSPADLWKFAESSDATLVIPTK